MIPPTIGVYVSTIKESSLASIIGFVELLGQGMAIREANALRGTADVLAVVAFGYFVICFTLSQLGRYLERRTARELQLATALPPTAPALGMVHGQLNSQNSDRPPAVQFYLSPDSRSVTQGRGYSCSFCQTTS
jgi:ABC-type arginine transport system permease subunit